MAEAKLKLLRLKGKNAGRTASPITWGEAPGRDGHSQDGEAAQVRNSNNYQAKNRINLTIGSGCRIWGCGSGAGRSGSQIETRASKKDRRGETLWDYLPMNDPAVSASIQVVFVLEAMT